MYSPDERGAARRIAEEWGHSLAWCEERQRWMVRREGETIWRDDTLVERTTKALVSCERQATDHPSAKGLLKPAFVRNALDFAKPFIAVEMKMFDKEPWALNVPGGLINLKTLEFVPPEKVTGLYRFCTRVTPCKMDTPLWDAHLMTMCHGDIEVISYLKRLAGITLIGDQDLKPHVSPQLNGLGRNGKGVFLQGFGWALGDYSQFASTRLLTTTENSHTTEQAGLRGMRLVVVEEVKRINSSLFKDLTGGGELRARKMREDDREFEKSWTLWFNNNGPMHFMGDTSDGLWDRVPTIDLGRGIPEDKRIDDMAVRLQEEGPGVLQWALDGLQDFYELDHDLCPPESVRQKSAERRLDADPLRVFLNDCYEKNDDGKVLGSTFIKHYSAWCKEREERAGGMKVVYAELRDRFGLSVKPGHENKTFIYGLKQKQTIMEDIQQTWN